MENLSSTGLTAQFGNATVLAVAGTTLNLSVATVYSIRGKQFSKAISGTEATPTTDLNTGLAFKPVPKGYGCVFVIGLDAAGALKACQGEIVALQNDTWGEAPEFPATLPDTFCPICYMLTPVISTYVATTTGWLLGTHNTSGVTGVTNVIVNISSLPHRPQTS